MSMEPGARESTTPTRARCAWRARDGRGGGGRAKAGRSRAGATSGGRRSSVEIARMPGAELTPRSSGRDAKAERRRAQALAQGHLGAWRTTTRNDTMRHIVRRVTRGRTRGGGPPHGARVARCPVQGNPATGARARHCGAHPVIRMDASATRQAWRGPVG